MYRQWPFFRTLLSNMDMVLAKSDLALASRYAELVADARLRKTHLRARSRPSGIARSRRCARSPAKSSGWRATPALQRSIRHRFPYIDPLHHLQVELVRRYRAGQADERVPARHPHLDQRHRGGVAQHRLSALLGGVVAGSTPRRADRDGRSRRLSISTATENAIAK